MNEQTMATSLVLLLVAIVLIALLASMGPVVADALTLDVVR